MTELIVALDVDTVPRFAGLFHDLRGVEIKFFKVSVSNLMMPLHSLIPYMRSYDVDVFLDLKLYDTRDTVERIARQAFDLGVRFLTVHATPSMLAAAMRAKPAGDYAKVLAVASLTDNPNSANPQDLQGLKIADGLICSCASTVNWYRSEYPEFSDKILVLPGIRPKGTTSDNHRFAVLPKTAKRDGADYVVVGRPIIDAPDPVAAARAIMEMLS